MWLSMLQDVKFSIKKCNNLRQFNPDLSLELILTDCVSKAEFLRRSVRASAFS